MIGGEESKSGISNTFSTVLPIPPYLRVGRGLREVPGISMLARPAPGTASSRRLLPLAARPVLV
jgi:hypothetical protein